jgi:hypothetical protein
MLKNLCKNKKGQISQEGFGIVNIILFVAILFVLIFIGFAMALGGAVVDWTMDEVTPLMTNIGMVGQANLSQSAQYTFGTLNNFVQSFTWLSGAIYVIALVSMLGLAFAFKIVGNKWLIAAFFGMMFILVIACIFISNIYEDFYDDSGEMGDRLHEYQLLSFMILYSPMVMCLIGFIGGIIMFTGYNQDEG